jgi:hypothetical protein
LALLHNLSAPDATAPVRPKQITFYFSKTNQGIILSRGAMIAAGLVLALSMGCGPRAHIPPRPANIPGALAASDRDAIRARALAPLLYIQKDEWFPLERVVAVVHPTRPIIAYHLLWRDDVHGSWVPFTVPTDEEIVWVGFDSTSAPNEIWTFWHGDILHADWRDRGRVEIDVQWGKHGSMPRGIVESDLPGIRKLNGFYFFSWLGLPDIWLGNLTRRGPWCFCGGYGRYRDYSKLVPLNDRIDVVVRAEDAGPALREVFGKSYSKKKRWPTESTSRASSAQ